MKGDAEKCFVAGMDDYVAKPIDTQHLQNVIKKWLGRNSKRQKRKIG